MFDFLRVYLIFFPDILKELCLILIAMGGLSTSPPSKLLKLIKQKFIFNIEHFQQVSKKMGTLRESSEGYTKEIKILLREVWCTLPYKQQKLLLVLF